jgi:cold shock CspA family protein
MSKSQETFNKKEVRNKKEKKRKEKEKKRLERKDAGKRGDFQDMIAYVDENGMITTEIPDPAKKNEVKLEDIRIAVPKQDDQKKDLTRKGTVTFFNVSKGFGFIRDHESKASVFVHINNVSGQIAEGNLVQYELGAGPKGPVALKVEPVK